MTSLFSSPKPSPLPPAPDPVAMPDSGDEATLRAKKRKIAEIQARSGRMSTILTDNTESSQTLGG